MYDPLRKVASGDQLEISAVAYNAFVDAARAQRSRQFDRSGRSQPVAVPGNIRVRNNTGSDCQAFDVVGIAGPVFGPDDDLNQFQRHVTLSVTVPDAAAVASGRIAILAEPLMAGRIGRAYISGTCAARIKILDPNHVCAVPAAGVTDYLESSAGGPFQVLWNETVESGEIAWSLVRFGGGGGAVEIRLARIVDFRWTEPPTEIAVGFLGFLVDSVGVGATAPPAEELLDIDVWSYPPVIFGRDLRYAVPGIPFDVPGRSDVPIAWFPDPSIPPEDGGGRYRLLWAMHLVCISPWG